MFENYPENRKGKTIRFLGMTSTVDRRSIKVIVELCEDLFRFENRKNSAHQVLSGSWPCTLRRGQLQHENLLQTARKGVGEAVSDFRSLSIASLAKADGCANRLIEKELAVLCG